MNVIDTVQTMIGFNAGKVEINLDALFQIEEGAFKMRQYKDAWTDVEREAIRRLGEIGRALAVCDLDRAQKASVRLADILNPVYEGRDEYEPMYEDLWLMSIELRDKLENLSVIDLL